MLYTIAVAFLAAVELPSHAHGLRLPSPCPVNATDAFEIQIPNFSKALSRRSTSYGTEASEEHREQVWLPRSSGTCVTGTDYAS
jgi:hypothetical protein